ncbi:hypothetical protein P692DRAFT_20150008 [Suillus brevipes Sb2]|nr:hypothetical protein P692DRAFT_20150008 [Suillus brevipes Sb2]
MSTPCLSVISTLAHHPFHPKGPAPSFAQSKSYSLSWSHTLRSPVHHLRAIVSITFKLPYTIGVLVHSSATCRGYSSPRGSVKFSRLICITLISLSVILRWAHPTMLAAP